jgi:uncharacterized paraquat-inducible protein A
MNKQTVGSQLKSELERGYDIVRISRWAFRIYSENIRSLDPSLRKILENLFSMEDDPQFVLTADELRILSDKLISEGKKEELYEPIHEIKEVAQELDEDWLMCPLCYEAWEDPAEYGMVCCPKCKHKLHNPRYRKAEDEIMPNISCDRRVLAEEDLEKAIVLDDARLKCPNCSDVWDSRSQHELVVTCPKCQKYLRNPRFKADL